MSLCCNYLLKFCDVGMLIRVGQLVVETFREGNNNPRKSHVLYIEEEVNKKEITRAIEKLL